MKIGTSNLTLLIKRPIVLMTNDPPQLGRGRAHVTHFCMRNSELRKHIAVAGRPSLNETDNAVDGGSLLLAPTTVDASDATQ